MGKVSFSRTWPNPLWIPGQRPRSARVGTMGGLVCINKELAVTLFCQQRCDNGRCVGRQSGVGGDGEVARCEHPGSQVMGRCCCLVKIACHGPRLPMANHPDDERIDTSSKQCHGFAGS